MNTIFNLSRRANIIKNGNRQYFGDRDPAILYANVLGARQFGNLAFASALLIGGLGFLFSALCSFICLTLYWNVGAGSNEINKREQLIRIQRKGYPGKSQKILLTYEISDVKALEIKIIEGINPTQVIYLCMKNERQIPLIFTDQLPSITRIEQRGILLSNFLKVPLELKTIKTI